MAPLSYRATRRCWRCGSPDIDRRRRICLDCWAGVPPPKRPSGQALVEMALVLPVLMFVIIGFAEGAFLFAHRDHQARATGVVADWAGERPTDSSWVSVAHAQLPDCDVEREDPRPGLVTIRATCPYTPLILAAFWDGLDISTEESAATREPDPSPSPTATPSPTP